MKHFPEVVLKKILDELKREEPRLAPEVGKSTQRLDQALPGKHTRKLYDRLSKGQAAVLSQLRTKKIKLNYYLAKVKIMESEVCECRREPESVGHFLLRCPRWTSERANMWRVMGKRSGNLSLLLGGWDPQSHADREEWRPDWPPWERRFSSPKILVDSRRKRKRDRGVRGSRRRDTREGSQGARGGVAGELLQ